MHVRTWSDPFVITSFCVSFTLLQVDWVFWNNYIFSLNLSVVKTRTSSKSGRTGRRVRPACKVHISNARKSLHFMKRSYLAPSKKWSTRTHAHQYCLFVHMDGRSSLSGKYLSYVESVYLLAWSEAEGYWNEDSLKSYYESTKFYPRNETWHHYSTPLSRGNIQKWPKSHCKETGLGI